MLTLGRGHFCGLLSIKVPCFHSATPIFFSQRLFRPIFIEKDEYSITCLLFHLVICNDTLSLPIIYVQSAKFSINVLDTSGTKRVLGNKFHWSMLFNFSIFEGGTDVWTFYLYRSHDSSQWWG